MKKSMVSKVKEQYDVRIKELPIVRTTEAWMITRSQDVVLASGRSDDDVVADWLRVSTDTIQSWVDVIDSGEGLTTLDVKLAEGLLVHFRDGRNNNNHNSQKLFLISQEQINQCADCPEGDKW